ncbi:MAG: TlpA family protein disulfide reductase [Tepidisphaerales bacterium]
MTIRSMAVAGLSVALGLLCIGLAQTDTRSLRGQQAPDITLDTLAGETFTLSDLKGNVVVMDYWATWCPPCRESLPHFNKLANDSDLAARGLRVFAINAREDAGKVQAFLQQNNYTFTVPMDPEGKFGQLYRVRGIPTTVIVGRSGKVREVFVGFGPGSAERIDRAIEAALKEPAPGSEPPPAPSK